MCVRVCEYIFRCAHVSASVSLGLPACTCGLTSCIQDLAVNLVGEQTEESVHPFHADQQLTSGNGIVFVPLANFALSSQQRRPALWHSPSYEHSRFG